MGKKVCTKAEKIEDKEVSPEVIERRTRLYNQYVAPFYNMIYKLCIQYTNSPCDVQENYTEVLTNFYRRIETYNPSRPIRTWLHIVTKRHVRALDKRRANKFDYSEFNENSISESDNSLDGEARETMLGVDNYRDFYNDNILSILDEMKPIYRDALILQEAGYSLKEILEIEYNKGTLKSRSIDTVKSRLFLARKILKNNLTRDGKRIKNQRPSDQSDDGGFYEHCLQDD